MTNKIFRSIICASIITFMACFVFIMGILYEYFNNGLLNELKNEAVLVEQGIESDGEDYLRGLDTPNRITWIDSDGSVIYDTDFDSESLENHKYREEISEAFENGSGSSQRYSDTIAQKNVYYAKLLDDGTVVRVSSLQYSVWSLLLAMTEPGIFVLVIALIISILLARALSKKIIKPINDIDLDHPDIDENYPEISPLLKKINRQNLMLERQMKKLKKNEEDFAAITSNMKEGLIIIDNMTSVMSINHGARKLLDIQDEGLGVSVFNLNRSESFRNVITKALEGRHSEELEEFNGRTYQLIANPVFDENKVNGAVIFIIDVTEKEQCEALRKEFTSNVSHELRTPLTSIYGTSEIMANGIVKLEDMERFAKNIHDETGRLISLINDIIQLSQLDEKSFDAETLPVDLYITAKNVISRVDEEAEKKGISVTLNGDNTVVNAIPSMIDEIIFNLCENSIKYNNDGGKVSVFVGKENGNSIIRVSDTGIGISKEDCARIFERFYRADKSHSKKNGGTGLGLSIVKHAASYNNATVKVESELGKGSVFTVTFDKSVAQN